MRSVVRRAQPRERILDAAAELFDRHGVHPVGVQQIIDHVGCGKNLLYSEFDDKDELVVAYLRRCRDEWDRITGNACRARAGDPAGQLVNIVRAVARQASRPGFGGCPVHNTYAEYPEPTHPVHKAAADHFRATRQQLRDLAESAGAPRPQQLADRIMLIIDGLNSNGAALGRQGAVKESVAFAEDVVRDAL